MEGIEMETKYILITEYDELDGKTNDYEIFDKIDDLKDTVKKYQRTNNYPKIIEIIEVTDDSFITEKILNEIKNELFKKYTIDDAINLIELQALDGTKIRRRTCVNGVVNYTCENCSVVPNCIFGAMVDSLINLKLADKMKSLT